MCAEGPHADANEGEDEMDAWRLTRKQKADARACTSVEELRALAAQEGTELTDEQLEAVSGGSGGVECNRLEEQCPQLALTYEEGCCNNVPILSTCELKHKYQ